MKAVRLRTADLLNPIGIDVRSPRLTWNAYGGTKQTAYQLVARNAEGRTVFDSGKVPGDHMYCIYAGEALKSRDRISWRVALWDEDEDNLPEWSGEAYFEMGLLEPSDWQAKWIAGVDTDRAERLPADYFRKYYTVKQGLVSARLYATALGVYYARLNRIKVTTPLAPGTTEYEKRLYYQTYDVTPYVKAGEENEIIFTLGDGWYKGKIGALQNEYFFGTQTALFAQLELSYEDGSREVIATDGSFRWTNDGPIRFSDLKDGEVYDARKCYEYDAPTKRYTREDPYRGNAVELHSETRIPTSSNAAYITEHETFNPKLLISPSGAKILDFGQNLAGYVRFYSWLPEGQEMRLRLFEALDHGEYSNTSLSFPMSQPAVETVKQEIIYIGSGRGDLFQPEFFYSGFRYALVEGVEEVNPEYFEAVSVYSDIEYFGDFDCSNEAIVKFLRNTRWSMKSNFIDVPTDCPQREKSGWTGDAQVFCRTATYLGATKAFFRKWLKDVRDCQRENGLVEDVNPKASPSDSEHAMVNGAVGWADAVVIIPYTIWKLTGDSSFITDNLELMRAFADQRIVACADKSMLHLPDEGPYAMMKKLYDTFKIEDSELNKYVVESGIHWGEWLVAESQEPSVTGNGITDLLMPKQEVGTAYTYYSMKLLSEMLEKIGEKESAVKYREFAEGAKKAYHFHWVKNGTTDTKRMAELVRPLALGILSEEEEKVFAEKLNEMAVSRHYKVGTGFLSTPFVLQVLAEHGYIDTAYRMLENREAPGWLAMAEKGATTVWEEYECYDGDGHPLAKSMNHYSPGAVCAFLFDTVAGVKVTGENHVTIRPMPGGTLSYAAAVVHTSYGKVVSSWEASSRFDPKRKLTFMVEIPANMTATLILPDGKTHELQTGSYTFHSYPA